MLAPRHSGQIMTKNVKTLFVGLCFVFANQIDSNKCHANSLILTRTFCFRSLFAEKKSNSESGILKILKIITPQILKQLKAIRNSFLFQKIHLPLKFLMLSSVEIINNCN